MTTTMSTMTSRCEEDSQSDYVSVTSDHVTQDDRATSDNHVTAQDHVTSAARRMCGANAQYTDVEQVRSEASTLYVQFRSNDVFDATGFEATYQFYLAVQGRDIVDVLNAR